MTAGRGIVHSEMPSSSEEAHGLQLWINLPKVDKMMPPRYQEISSKDIPSVTQGGISVRVLAGECMGIKVRICQGFSRICAKGGISVRALVGEYIGVKGGISVIFLARECMGVKGRIYDSFLAEECECQGGNLCQGFSRMDTKRKISVRTLVGE